MKKDLPEIRKLLKKNNLPVQDVNSSQMMFYVIRDKEIIACGGVERSGDTALLRSLAVVEKYRGSGLGRMMLSHMIHETLNRDTREIFLLTETAYTFFNNQGFEAVHRENVPLTIRSIRQYSELCADTAVVMKLKK